MNEETAAQCLEALGHPKRLAIYRLLVKAGHDGLPVGAIGERTGTPGSTLNHHLGLLVRAGLVVQERDGRTIVCRTDFAVMQDILDFMTEECCRGVALTETGAAA